MEVKFKKSNINFLKLEIYINKILWKVVKASYFEKKMPTLLKANNFKEEFIRFEKKKAIEISLYLLNKRSYLKKEWQKKMQFKLFAASLLEEIYEENLLPYFNEKEEVRRRLEMYYSKGKSMWWVQMKMSPDIYLPRAAFNNLLYEIFSEEKILKKIKDIALKKSDLKKRGRDKIIAFFLRRGFTYDQITKALF